MALRNSDKKKLISTIMISLGSFWLLNDIQGKINESIGMTASIIIGIVVLLIAGYLFNL